MPSTNVDHAVSVMGVEHVGLGGDFTKQLADAMHLVTPPAMKLGTPLGATIEGLEGPEGYPRLVEALEARGYAGADLEAILGGNLLRVLRRALRE